MPFDKMIRFSKIASILNLAEAIAFAAIARVVVGEHPILAGFLVVLAVVAAAFSSYMYRYMSKLGKE